MNLNLTYHYLEWEYLKTEVKHMEIKDLLKIVNESDRVSALYDIFEEGTRLSTKAAQVEFLTTLRQIEKHLKPGMKIL